MNRLSLVFLLFVPFLSSSQNLPQCDSLIISCCAFDSFGENTITLLADNPSTELFSYPAFVMMNDNLDTIAKEPVTYFGISTWSQPHTMDIVAPLNLPFTGYLDLYTFFCEELACHLPFFIEDTLTVVSPDREKHEKIMVFPNPADGEIQITGIAESITRLFIFDLSGRLIKSLDRFEGKGIDISDLPAGSFLLKSSGRVMVPNQKLIVIRQ